MPDAGTLHQLPPRGWSHVFAALPLESPPADGWSKVSARLATRQRRWPMWLAVAATLALAVGLPLRWAAQQTDAPAVATTSAAAQPATATSTRDTPAFVPVEPVQSDSTMSADTVSADIMPVDIMPVDSAAKPVPAVPTPAATGNDQAVPAATQLASTSPDATSAAVPDPGRAELDLLHAQSAQLEALLAVARDERVSSASAAVLGDDFVSRVGSIDAALMQPSLSDRQRTGLWRERVLALRRLVGFESTQRMLAAYGQRDDARMASID